MRRRTILRPGRRYRRRRLLVGGATLLLVGGAAYKIGQSQAQQIQQHTGKPPEDLTQEELEQAMDDLGIEEQELTAQDQAAIEAEAIDDSAPSQQPAPPPPAPSAAPPAPKTDYIQELERLADLRDRGIITNEDFEAKKKQLLGL
jgi:hypothetical protein